MANIQSKKILITGATSGIGAALAKEYAASDITLFLTGRNQERLDKITKICESKGAKVVNKILDVRDKAELEAWIFEIDEKYGLDLVVADAGISAGTSKGVESEAQIKEIFSTNIDGVLNTVNPAVKVMIKREKSGSKFKGQIAIVSSLAGFRGLPPSPAYSASKSCVRVYAEALRGSLAPHGIAVNAICPGYVRTPMTDVNNFAMPFIIEPEKAAKIIRKGLSKNKSRIAFPLPFYFMVWLVTLLSTSITDPLFERLPKKESL